MKIVWLNSSMNILKQPSSSIWGADMKTLKKLYQSLIKSKLDNGNEIYVSTNKISLKSLVLARNKALRVPIGSFGSYPYDSLELMSRSLPMQCTWKSKLINYMKKIKINETNAINHTLIYIRHFEKQTSEKLRDRDKLQPRHQNHNESERIWKLILVHRENISV